MTLDDVAGGLSNLFQGIQEMINASVKMHGALIPLGQKFFLLAVTLTVMNDVYQWWIKGDATELLAKGLRLFVVASIPFALLFSNNAWQNVNQSLVGFFQAEVPKALGSGGGGDLRSLIDGTVKKVVDAVTVEPPKKESGFKWSDSSTWRLLGEEIMDGLSSLGGMITELVLKIVVFIGVAAMMLAMLVSGYIPLVALQVGIIVGPILVAWLPFEPLANYAHTWLKFMVVNAMTIVVAIILLLMVGAGIGSITSTLGGMMGEDLALGGIGVIASIFMILTILLFIAFMLFQADEIASGLIGHSSVGGGFMGRAMSMALGKAAGSRTGGAIKGAGDKGGSIIGKAGSAISQKTGFGDSVASGGEKMFYKGVQMAGGGLFSRAGGKILMSAGNSMNKIGEGSKSAARIKSVLDKKI